jgi:hypothetical protein
MPIRLSARLVYANGAVAKGVKVAVYDRDQPGQEDDNLTTSPGTTDEQGNFTVEYDSSRYQDSSLVTITAPRNPPLDWSLETRTVAEPNANDLFQPYLKFTYMLNGVEKSAVVDLKSKRKEYQLPQPLPHSFQPKINGFQFVNRFSGLFLPIALPFGLGQPNSIYGLCGGMSAAAADFLLAGRKIPATDTIPATGEPLHRYLYQRQMDSLGAFGDTMLRFVDWMGRPDEGPQGTEKLNLTEFENKIRSRLNNFRPVVLGMLYVKWSDSREVWLNHQVLAYRYTRTPDLLKIDIYDPNYPKRNDISIEAEKTASGLKCVQRIGTTSKKLYGFFAIPHTPVIPPLQGIDE